MFCLFLALFALIRAVELYLINGFQRYNFIRFLVGCFIHNAKGSGANVSGNLIFIHFFKNIFHAKSPSTH